MAALKDILAYILTRYPHRSELSNARVTKMVYLSDWKHVLEHGTPVSNIRWVFDNYGPFVWDVMRAAEKHPDLFRVEPTENMFGATKRLLSCINPSYVPKLTESERDAIDHTIEKTQPLSWDKFIGLVYSTYPILSSERYSELDLRRAADEYKKSPVYREVSPSAL